MNPDVYKRLIECKDNPEFIREFIQLLKDESGLEEVKVHFFESYDKIECLAKDTNLESEILTPNHSVFNCMIYNLKKFNDRIIDEEFLKENNLKCKIVTEKNKKIAFSCFGTNIKEGIILGYNTSDKEITQEQLNIMKDFGATYANLFEVFHRLEIKKKKIDYLTFLENFDVDFKAEPNIEEFMTHIQEKFSKVFGFDASAYISYKDPNRPKTIREGVKSYYRGEISDKELAGLLAQKYPNIDVIYKKLKSHELYCGSTEYMKQFNFDITNVFEGVVFLPLYISKDHIDFIIAFNRKHKECSQETYGQLKYIQGRLESVIKNTRKLFDIKTEYKTLLKNNEHLTDEIMKDKQRMFNIVNGMDEPLIAISEDWYIKIFNDAAENLFGVDKEDVVNKDAKEFIKTHKIPIRTDKLRFKRREIKFTSNDQFYKIIKSPYNADEEKQGTILVFENITKEKAIEELKNEFISILSHEMKTPLTSITGFSKLLLNKTMGELTDQQKDSVDVIYDEGIRLKNLVDDILNIDRLEKGKLNIDKKFTNLLEIFNDVIDNKIIVKNNFITLKKDFPKEMPDVLADEDKLRQVLINLISNAINYSKENEPGTITTKVELSGKYVMVKVSDTGIGMSKEETKKIFNKFYQASNHLTRNTGGLGLGLAIVKKILDLHKGHIEVDSKLNIGTTFTFYLPIN